jgi:hypothetical protein
MVGEENIRTAHAKLLTQLSVLPEAAVNKE